MIKQLYLIEFLALLIEVILYELLFLFMTVQNNGGGKNTNGSYRNCQDDAKTGLRLR